MSRPTKLGACLALTLSCAVIGTPLLAQDADDAEPRLLKPEKNPVLDRSGEPRRGKASYYGSEFYGKTMADGTPMNPESNIAASRTLPLGTKAEVVNLENGKSEVVEIRDRGPYIDGRIIDLTPRTAESLDMTEQGVVAVEVRPIEVPQADGSVKPGTATLQTALGDEEE